MLTFSWSLHVLVHFNYILATQVQSKENQTHLSALTALLRYNDCLRVYLFSTPSCPLLPSSWAQLRRELQDCLQGLKSCTESLRVSEKSLSECQDNLQRSHWKCSEKTESIRQLQAKVWTKSRSWPWMYLGFKYPLLATRGWYFLTSSDGGALYYESPTVKLDIFACTCLCCVSFYCV